MDSGFIKYLRSQLNKPSAREIHASDSGAYLTGPMNPVRLATDNDQPGWDSYVLSNPDAGPYHLYAWKTAVEQGYGHKGLYLMAEDTDSGFLVGVLPLICFVYHGGSANRTKPHYSSHTHRDHRKPGEGNSPEGKGCVPNHKIEQTKQFNLI